MFWWKRDCNEAQFPSADEAENRLVDKQQEVERRDVEVRDVVAKLKSQADRNHFGEALVISFGAKARGA